MTVERYEIEAFLAVADHLHFGRAAEQLHVTSGRITQTIQRLERRLGARLFDRTTRRVALTRIGQQLLTDLRPGYDQIHRAIQRATDAGRGFEGRLSVGFLGAAAGQLTYSAGREFLSLSPETDFDICEVRMSDGIDGWLGEERDMVLVDRPLVDPALTLGPVLISERRMLAISTRHPLAARTAIDFEDLAQVRLLRVPEAWPAALAADRNPRRTPNGRPISHGKRANTFEEMVALASAGEGGFLVGGSAATLHQRPCVTYLPVLDGAPIELGLVWRTSHETNKIRTFSEIALSTSRSSPHCASPSF
ncbi:LysR family transcriptional regulator [Nocardia sp. NPDC059240]|uniref:LysR family transcriptional regulator n=1 Tax=Nocardia sp. NPDC059240 TaxID=3346786 RepID=UPI0036CB9C35